MPPPRPQKLKNKSAIMSNIFSRLKIQDIFDRDPDKFEPHPRRAWAIIFSAGIVLIILVLVFQLSFYVYMHSERSFKPDDSSLGINEVKLNRKGLAEVTAMFETKNAQFQDLLVSAPKVADPSAIAQRSPSIGAEGALKSGTGITTSASE
jgi:hypothetical protein